MDRMGGFKDWIVLAMAGTRSPWGNDDKPGNGAGEGDGHGSGSDPSGDGPAPSDDKPDTPKGPRNPWLPAGGDTPEPRRSASIEDIFRNRGPEGPRRNPGGPGGPRGPNFQLPRRKDGKSWVPTVIVAALAVGIASSMFHLVGPKEQGVVTTLGHYSRTIQPGISITGPWPIEQVKVTDVTSIRSERIPGNGEEKLILTGDQNLVDLSYLIRWNIKNLTQFEFQLKEPQETVEEVAEAAMRASVSTQTLDQTLSGAGRAAIEENVRLRMQQILDAYRSGIAVQGIEIEKTDPPERVIEAFKGVSAAQQDAETEINRARAWAQQILARAQGDAAAFDRVYAEYKLAPEVTRRRMYYDTMERVLSQTDKTVVETNGVQTYLPLPEVRRSSRPAPQPTAASPAGQPAGEQ